MSYKVSLDDFKRIEIIQNNFPDHHGIKVEISNRYLEYPQIFGNHITRLQITQASKKKLERN